MTPECDNKTQAHMMLELTSAPGGSRAYCRLCRRTYYLRHNANGAPEKRQYAKLFYRDVVQRNKPLFYKIHPEAMQLGGIV